MILADSSVWIDFFRGRSTAAVQHLESLLSDSASTLVMADLVCFEVLRGFRQDAQLQAAQDLLKLLPAVQIGGTDAALTAAEHYRALRACGYTISSPIDVLLASFCIANDCLLLHSDADFHAMESLRGLKAWSH